jgi:hypothetical protein
MRSTSQLLLFFSSDELLSNLLREEGRENPTFNKHLTKESVVHLFVNLNVIFFMYTQEFNTVKKIMPAFVFPVTRLPPAILP